MLKETITLILILIVLNITFIYLNNKYLVTRSVAETAISGDYDESHIKQWNTINDLMNVFKYIKSPIKIILSISILSAFFFFIFNSVRKIKMRFLEIARIVIMGHYVYLLPAILTFAWFSFIQTDYTYIELGAFDIFSFKHLFDQSRVSELENLIYNTISWIDLFFILLLGYMFSQKSKDPSFSYFNTTLATVALSIISMSYSYLLS